MDVNELNNFVNLITECYLIGQRIVDSPKLKSRVANLKLTNKHVDCIIDGITNQLYDYQRLIPYLKTSERVMFFTFLLEAYDALSKGLKQYYNKENSYNDFDQLIRDLSDQSISKKSTS